MRAWNKVDRKRWARVRRRVFQRDGWRCRRCGKAGRLECHHSTPQGHGDFVYDLDALESVCRGCHIKITTMENRRRAPGGGLQVTAWGELVQELVDETS